jgi:hypothetical protein
VPLRKPLPSGRGPLPPGGTTGRWLRPCRRVPLSRSPPTRSPFPRKI